MINVIGQCVEASNEKGARELFDVLEVLLILVSEFWLIFDGH
jgi:importin-4